MLEMTIVDATALGQKDDVIKLISAGKSVEAADANGDRPVSIAAFRNDFETLKVLVAAGAKVTIYDSHDKTPLDWARIHANQDMQTFIEEAARNQKKRLNC